ncbi:50S ribosomal protein L17 [Chlamydiales bacterium SCGC AG-110-P3]|nr:50S ribosomal protein L17 [Chlamydiales bacterium SCGC AG-110-P3]
MRHGKRTIKLNRNGSHRRCLTANMLKALIQNERIVTTEAKAKALRIYADKMITLAKKDTLASRRQAIGEMMVRFNKLNAKEARLAKEGKTDLYNEDRLVIEKLFGMLGPRFASRKGGYTRIIKTDKHRLGDNSRKCILEFLDD